MTTPTVKTPLPTPAEPCDLVMRGGITSGLVYPKAVMKLKDRYWFRGIAGSSVGVVAAAATAAAELGRATGGFEKLDRLSEDLAKPGRLLRLFQATRETAPALRLFLRLLDGGSWWAAAGAVGAFWRFAVIWLMVSAAFVPVAAFGWSGGWGPWVAVVGVAIGLLAAVALTPWSVLRHLKRMAEAVRRNDLGVCTGMDGVGGSQDSPALTEYLHRELADLSGLGDGAVLTFGHLRRYEAAGTARPIELKMVTTNLSTQTPVVFPLPVGAVMVFNEGQFLRLFPAAVVKHMVTHQPDGRDPLPDGWYYLPDADELPVLVPTRISLAHPVLFCGVPLYGLSAGHRAGEAIQPEHLRRHLFSDGGIVSNFPIHIFDRWLPRAPTFGINLGEVVETEGPLVPASALAVPPDSSDVSRGAVRRVHLGEAGQEPVLPWVPVDDWGGLAAAIFYAAKNHRDNAQALLPSYRERVVTVLLADNEGGLNLNMSAEVVRRLMEYGTEAGQRLAESFDFDAHRWTRLRIVLARLEEQLRAVHADLGAAGDYRRLLRHGSGSPLDPFPLSDAERAAAERFVEGLWEFLNGQFGNLAEGPLAVHPPANAPSLRFVPADQEGGKPVPTAQTTTARAEPPAG